MHQCESECATSSQRISKPIEIYSFVDPLCPECWGLEPIIKKLQIEYGDYFTIRHLIGGNLATLNSYRKKKKGINNHKDMAKKWEQTANRSGMSCDGDLWFEDPISTPYGASIAVKAAELQGKRAGSRFLRKLREVVFLQKQNITKEEVLLHCAEDSGLDLHEFQKDLHSQGAIKAFQCDMKITYEMEVDELPTLVFFNENIDEEGIKVTGMYNYDVYVNILREMLKVDPTPDAPPPLEDFLKKYKFVATQEVAVVYGISSSLAESKMKALSLKQVVERIPVKYGTFWRYIGD
ncbi:ClpXP adapter SpxH family protein [Pseudalkalibacillus caeni]|uniref:ClpXP adapter SpxH family protein n=1 Tax=Exobacillus caeni TaxID=2574798 RepID=UPI001FE848D5|nr:ClpXP adapter SpxH family protein [Pseudalkalibacillus caeni]